MSVARSRTLQRTLYLVRHADPRYGPVKHDIKDGFYRLFFNPLGCLRMSIILPRHPGDCPNRYDKSGVLLV